jgi:hypothetical protein
MRTNGLALAKKFWKTFQKKLQSHTLPKYIGQSSLVAYPTIENTAVSSTAKTNTAANTVGQEKNHATKPVNTLYIIGTF